ncbi:MAG: Gmad2 immunoglobulin-like domain-containing protein [Thermoleophilia bacterium]
MNRKILAIVMLISLIVGGVAGAAVMYLMGDDGGSETRTATTGAVSTRGDTGDGVACPQDARQCADGSYVGRTGPDCEFAPCPELPPVVQSENIKVYAPAQGAQVTSPLVISGEARVFEGTVNFRILDDTGSVIAEGFTTAASEEMGEFGPYAISADFTPPATAFGKLEVFNYSARDGSVENLVTVIVRFG